MVSLARHTFPSTHTCTVHQCSRKELRVDCVAIEEESDKTLVQGVA